MLQNITSIHYNTNPEYLQGKHSGLLQKYSNSDNELLSEHILFSLTLVVVLYGTEIAYDT